MADSEVRIRTALDNSGIRSDINKSTREFDKQVKVIQKQSQELDVMNNKLKAIASGDVEIKSISKIETDLKRATKEVQIQQKAYDDLIAKIQVAQTGVEFATGIGRPQEIIQAQNELQRLDEESIDVATNLANATDKATNLVNRIKQVKLDPSTSDEAIELKNRIVDTSTQLESSKNNANNLNNEIQRLATANVGQLNSGLEGTNGQFKKILQSVSRFAIALFGIRTIYNVLSNLGREYIAQNEQLANKLDYVKSALANTLGPVVEYLVNAFIQVLTYVGAIIKVLTGVNIFAGSYSKYMANSAKSAKQIQKSMHSSSIDELNVMQEQQETGGGIGAGAGAPRNRFRSRSK